MSQVEADKFTLVVSYPLSPLQGFLAAIGAALPV
jgi:hypothetical protein